MSTPKEPTRLMIVLEVSAGAAERLQAALGAADVASVVLMPAADGILDAATAAPLVAAIQTAGAAAIILGDARLARTLKADGVHVPASDAPSEAYALAREIVGARMLVGIETGTLRHDAMTAGEEGADYVAFGIPDPVKNRDIAAEHRTGLVQWWAEIFEVACVALDAASLAEAAALAEAGADFVALRLGAGTSPAVAAETARTYGAAIQQGRLAS